MWLSLRFSHAAVAVGNAPEKPSNLLRGAANCLNASWSHSGHCTAASFSTKCSLTCPFWHLKSNTRITLQPWLCRQWKLLDHCLLARQSKSCRHVLLQPDAKASAQSCRVGPCETTTVPRC